MSHAMKLLFLALILTVSYAKNATVSNSQSIQPHVSANAAKRNGTLQDFKSNKSNSKPSLVKVTNNTKSDFLTKKAPVATKAPIAPKLLAPKNLTKVGATKRRPNNTTKLEQPKITNSTVEKEIPPLSSNDSGPDTTTEISEQPEEEPLVSKKTNSTIDLIEDFTVELLENRGSLEEPAVIGKIFNKGKLAPYFRICATEDEAHISEDIYPISRRDCFRDSGFTDHIEFKYYYPSSLFEDGNTVISSAQIVHREDDRSQAFISNKEARTLTASEPFGVVQIYYGCMENTTETLALILEVKNTTHTETIKMSWEKTCTTGNAWHIKIRNKSPSKETILWPYEDVERNMFVSPSQMSTNLEVSINQRYLNQYFMEPTITASNSSIVVTSLRGTESKGGILHSGIPVNFNVMYACKGAGDSMVEFTMGVPPFQNISFSWWKGTYNL